jgi:hypothetical protein
VLRGGEMTASFIFFGTELQTLAYNEIGKDVS